MALEALAALLGPFDTETPDLDDVESTPVFRGVLWQSLANGIGQHSISNKTARTLYLRLASAIKLVSRNAQLRSAPSSSGADGTWLETWLPAVINLLSALTSAFDAGASSKSVCGFTLPNVLRLDFNDAVMDEDDEDSRSEGRQAATPRPKMEEAQAIASAAVALYCTDDYGAEAGPLVENVVSKSLHLMSIGLSQAGVKRSLQTWVSAVGGPAADKPVILALLQARARAWSSICASTEGTTAVTDELLAVRSQIVASSESLIEYACFQTAADSVTGGSTVSSSFVGASLEAFMLVQHAVVHFGSRAGSARDGRITTDAEDNEKASARGKVGASGAATKRAAGSGPGGQAKPQLAVLSAVPVPLYRLPVLTTEHKLFQLLHSVTVSGAGALSILSSLPYLLTAFIRKRREAGDADVVASGASLAPVVGKKRGREEGHDTTSAGGPAMAAVAALRCAPEFAFLTETLCIAIGYWPSGDASTMQQLPSFPTLPGVETTSASVEDPLLCVTSQARSVAGLLAVAAECGVYNAHADVEPHPQTAVLCAVAGWATRHVNWIHSITGVRNAAQGDSEDGFTAVAPVLADYSSRVGGGAVHAALQALCAVLTCTLELCHGALCEDMGVILHTVAHLQSPMPMANRLHLWMLDFDEDVDEEDEGEDDEEEVDEDSEDEAQGKRVSRGNRGPTWGVPTLQDKNDILLSTIQAEACLWPVRVRRDMRVSAPNLTGAFLAHAIGVHSRIRQVPQLLCSVCEVLGKLPPSLGSVAGRPEWSLPLSMQWDSQISSVTQVLTSVLRRKGASGEESFGKVKGKNKGKKQGEAKSPIVFTDEDMLQLLTEFENTLVSAYGLHAGVLAQYYQASLALHAGAGSGATLCALSAAMRDLPPGQAGEVGAVLAGALEEQAGHLRGSMLPAIGKVSSESFRELMMKKVLATFEAHGVDPRGSDLLNMLDSLCDTVVSAQVELTYRYVLGALVRMHALTLQVCEYLRHLRVGAGNTAPGKALHLAVRLSYCVTLPCWKLSTLLLATSSYISNDSILHIASVVQNILLTIAAELHCACTDVAMSAVSCSPVREEVPSLYPATPEATQGVRGQENAGDFENLSPLSILDALWPMGSLLEVARKYGPVPIQRFGEDENDDKDANEEEKESLTGGGYEEKGNEESKGSRKDEDEEPLTQPARASDYVLRLVRLVLPLRRFKASPDVYVTLPGSAWSPAHAAREATLRLAISRVHALHTHLTTARGPTHAHVHMSPNAAGMQSQQSLLTSILRNGGPQACGVLELAAAYLPGPVLTAFMDDVLDPRAFQVRVATCGPSTHAVQLMATAAGGEADAAWRLNLLRDARLYQLPALAAAVGPALIEAVRDCLARIVGFFTAPEKGSAEEAHAAFSREKLFQALKSAKRKKSIGRSAAVPSLAPVRAIQIGSPVIHALVLAVNDASDTHLHQLVQASDAMAVSAAGGVADREGYYLGSAASVVQCLAALHQLLGLLILAGTLPPAVFTIVSDGDEVGSDDRQDNAGTRSGVAFALTGLEEGPTTGGGARVKGKGRKTAGRTLVPTVPGLHPLGAAVTLAAAGALCRSIRVRIGQGSHAGTSASPAVFVQNEGDCEHPGMAATLSTMQVCSQDACGAAYVAFNALLSHHDIARKVVASTCEGMDGIEEASPASCPGFRAFCLNGLAGSSGCSGDAQAAALSAFTHLYAEVLAASVPSLLKVNGALDTLAADGGAGGSSKRRTAKGAEASASAATALDQFSAALQSAISGPSDALRMRVSAAAVHCALSAVHLTATRLGSVSATCAGRTLAALMLNAHSSQAPKGFGAEASHVAYLEGASLLAEAVGWGKKCASLVAHAAHAAHAFLTEHVRDGKDGLDAHAFAALGRALQALKSGAAAGSYAATTAYATIASALATPALLRVMSVHASTPGGSTCLRVVLQHFPSAGLVQAEALVHSLALYPGGLDLVQVGEQSAAAFSLAVALIEAAGLARDARHFAHAHAAAAALYTPLDQLEGAKSPAVKGGDAPLTVPGAPAVLADDDSRDAVLSFARSMLPLAVQAVSSGPAHSTAHAKGSAFDLLRCICAQSRLLPLRPADVDAILSGLSSVHTAQAHLQSFRPVLMSAGIRGSGREGELSAYALANIRMPKPVLPVDGKDVDVGGSYGGKAVHLPLDSLYAGEEDEEDEDEERDEGVQTRVHAHADTTMPIVASGTAAVHSILAAWASRDDSVTAEAEAEADSRSPSLSSHLSGSAFAAACLTIHALCRHRQDAALSSMPLIASTLQCCLSLALVPIPHADRMRTSALAECGRGPDGYYLAQHLASLARALEQLPHLVRVARYHAVHLMTRYCALASMRRAATAVRPGGGGAEAVAGVAVPSSVRDALLPGVYALLDACRPPELQAIHSALGALPRHAAHAARAMLKATHQSYEREHKYTGKA